MLLPNLAWTVLVMSEKSFGRPKPNKETTMPGPAEKLDTIRDIVEAKKTIPGAMLPILHDIQDAIGYIPSEAVPLIAEALSVSRAEVHGVITYYHHFRQHPVGKHSIRICRAEACQSVGAEALLEHARKALGCGVHETTGDGEFSLEPVYCLGQCACGPSILVDEHKLYAHVTPAKFDALIQSARGEK